MEDLTLRKGRIRSDIWTYFINNGKKYSCTFCGKQFSSPTALTLRAHLSDSFNAKKYRTTLCTNLNSELSQQIVLEFEDKNRIYAASQHRTFTLDKNVSKAAINFFIEFNVPLTAIHSPNFLNLCKVLEYTSASDTLQVPTSQQIISFIERHTSNDNDIESTSKEYDQGDWIKVIDENIAVSKSLIKLDNDNSETGVVLEVQHTDNTTSSTSESKDNPSIDENKSVNV
jgi:hypothetical protein